MPRSDWNLVANTEFGIPSEQEEQALIGSFFRDLDDLITLHQRKELTGYAVESEGYP